MNSPLYLHQVATSDYQRALSQANRRRLTSFVLRRQNDLLSLDAILQQCRLIGQRSLGVCTVAMENIIGSAGRTSDFDREFAPRRTVTRERWIDIIKAMYLGKPLPPVELRKIGDKYFVVDGHHRISAGRLLGQTYVDAVVVEMDIDGDLCQLGLSC